jgi:hypothetical protein
VIEMQKITKIGIVVAIVVAIALGIYALSTVKDTLVYNNVKITNISLQNWGDDFVYLSNGAVVRIWSASGLMIGHTYNVYRSWSGSLHFRLVS